MDGTPEDGGRPPISALVTTYNEERHIADCLASLDWCDEVLVVDSFSTDRTPEIVRGCERARFVQRTYYGSASQKNWAMDQTRNEWVLILDADERCTPELRAEIEALFQGGEPDQDAYTIKRRVFFLGKVIRFSGWQHDRVVRLLRRDAGRYPNRRVHADMLTRIRNANLALHSSVSMPSSKVKEQIAKLLAAEGYVEGYDVAPAAQGTEVTIRLKFSGR